jgi:RHS repeat-associated protein
VVAQLNPNGSFYWLHLDHLGSGRKMTDASGNMVYRAEFDPYGKLLFEWSSPSNLNTRKFTGYERDSATNLDYAQARIYGSEWGRFLSPDPAGMRVVNPTSPQSLNRYSYTDNNPVNRIDPTGEEWRIWIDLGASAEWLCRLGLEIFCDFSRTKAGGSGGGGGGADGRGLGIGVVVPIPTPAEAGIIFRRATDTATGISSTPNMLGRAKITFPAGPDKGFCKSGSEYTLFVEFEWTDIEEFIDPIKITGNGVKIIEVKGGRNSNVSYGRGDITIRWSWEGDNQLPDKRTIRIRLEGRTKPGYLDRTREATLFVDYDCKPS